jgi:hypothetical protein
MTETQSWVLIVEVGIIALGALLRIITQRP